MENNDITEELWEMIENPEAQEIYPESSGDTTTGIVRASHCNSIEKATRVEEIAEMLLQHKSNKEIKDFMVEKYGLSPETVRNYISDGNKLIVQQIPEVKSIISKNIDTYRRIIRDSESDDKRTTILAMAGMEKLLRLHGPETQNNTQINLQFDNVDTEELIELIKELSVAGK